MTTEYPFDRLPLLAGERIHLKRRNPTFHRAFDVSFAVSDRALYIWTRLPIRLGWKRLPLSDMVRVELREPSIRLRSWLQVVMVTVFLAFGLMMHGLTGDPGLVWGLFVGGFFIYAARVSIRGLRHRTELIVLLPSRRFVFRSPIDDYPDEKEYDRTLLREILDVLGQAGIEVHDCTKEGLGVTAPQSRTV